MEMKNTVVTRKKTGHRNAIVPPPYYRYTKDDTRSVVVCLKIIVVLSFLSTLIVWILVIMEIIEK